MNILTSKRSRRAATVLQLLASLFLLMLSHSAFAALNCSGGGQTYSINFPATINLPRNAPYGTQLTSWVSSPAITNSFSCTFVQGANQGVGYGIAPSGPQKTSYTWTNGGQTYALYDVGVPGVALAVGFSVAITLTPGNGCVTGWTAWAPVNADSASNRNYHVCWAGTNSTANFTVGSQIQATLVATGGPYQTGTTTSGTLFMGYATTTTNQNVTPGTTAPGNNAPLNYLFSAVRIVAQACTTPDVVVPLGTHSAKEMGSVGATTAATSFSISLNNCPSGLKSIQYRIDPVTTVLDAQQSVVALDSSSSATGVGVQLLNAAGTAATPLQSWQTLSSYNSSTGGSYSLPLSARYYQTSSTIAPGPANTSMTFTMQYQ